MAKVFVFTPLELRPDVDPAEFEKFMLEEFNPEKLGWKGHLVKSNRGSRSGQYAHLLEISSVESRDRFIPTPGQPSVEFLELWPNVRALMAKALTFVVSWPANDYVVLGE